MIRIYYWVDVVIGKIIPLTLLRHEILKLLRRSARPSWISIITTSIKIYLQLIVVFRTVTTLKQKTLTYFRTQPSTHIESFKINEYIRVFSPMLPRARSKRKRSIGIILPWCWMDLLKNHIEYSIFLREVITPNLNAKHIISLGWIHQCC